MMATNKSSKKSSKKAKKATSVKTSVKKTTATKKVAKKATAKKGTAKKTPKTSKATLSALPKVGQAAPMFSALNDKGLKVSLKDFAAKHLILYFYPKDDTPGCTIEACHFRDDYSELQSLNAHVIGVSPDDVQSHAKFKAKFSLNFDLLADTELSICKSYGVWVEKNMYGKKYMGVQRATFLIDGAGKIAAVWPKVKVEGHAAEVAEAIAKLG